MIQQLKPSQRSHRCAPRNSQQPKKHLINNLNLIRSRASVVTLHPSIVSTIIYFHIYMLRLFYPFMCTMYHNMFTTHTIFFCILGIRAAIHKTGVMCKQRQQLYMLLKAQTTENFCQKECIYTRLIAKLVRLCHTILILLPQPQPPPLLSRSNMVYRVRLVFMYNTHKDILSFILFSCFRFCSFQYFFRLFCCYCVYDGAYIRYRTTLILLVCQKQCGGARPPNSVAYKKKLFF